MAKEPEERGRDGLPELSSGFRSISGEHSCRKSRFIITRNERYVIGSKRRVGGASILG